MRFISSLVAFMSFFIQGYLFRDAIFKFIPSITKAIKDSTRGESAGRVKKIIVGALNIIVATIILLLLLPGILQIIVVFIVNFSWEHIAVGTVIGWFLGLAAKAVVIRIRQTKGINE